MMNVDQITTRLSMMDDKALETFATMHKNDPYLFPLAYSESTRRQHTRMAKRAQQAMPQPKVTDAAIAQMRPAPEPDMSQMAAAGIPQLAARNIETLADGGIAGFAEGSKKPIFNVDKYLEDPRVQRFLDYINMYEGSPQPNQMVGYRRFDDLSQHPNKRVKFNERGDKSTAAGAYQLINRTWQDQAKKQGLTDFSLENQKRAAVGVLKETGALDALMKGDVEKAKQRAARAWASIPGSTIGAATGQSAKFNPRAEQVLADIAPPTKTAEAGKPEAPRTKDNLRKQAEAARRREIVEALPLGAAIAGDEAPRRGAPAVTLPSTRDVGMRGLPLTPPSARRVGPAPVSEETMVDPMGGVISAPSTATGTIAGRSPQAGAAAATADYFANLLPFAAGEIAYGGARMATIPEETALGARAAAKDFMDPFGRMFGLTQEPGYREAPTTQLTEFVSKNLDKSAEWLSKNAPSGTLSVNDASNIQNLLLLGLGRGRGKPKEEVGLPGISARQKAAEAEAAAAAERAQTAALPRLEAPKSEVKPGFPVGVEPQKGQVFPLSPEAAAFGAEATSRRKLGEQAKDVRKAEEAAKAAAERAEAVRAEEAARAADQAGRAQVGAAAKAAIPSARNIPRAAAATNQAETPEAATTPPAFVDRRPPSAFEYRPYGEEAPPMPKPAEEKAPSPVAEKKAFGLDNEDLLMLGLGMLASPGGQAGSDLSQLFSNLGRSGMGAVAAKREREKLAEEKDYKNIMKQYYGKLTEMYGRPEAEERQIARIMQENPGISYEDAVQRLYAAKFASRGEYGLEAARLRNPFAALMDQGLMGTGGNLTSEGQSVFAKYFPKG